ncbi:hypothetical protein BE221DRAFT_176046 [Ostreococcus tauri]|uniref:Thioesterase domain-containing protein n=1 Tax=Ostreococcus tauri TaxID=70448 RepID=A0A1Y5I0Q3_OSTTA|nr:hypothetical protein BE221DRAFT_176046 [Ostreococcus tauri]
MPEAAIEERARMRMMNLSIELADMHAGVLELEADELDGCSSEREVRAYYESDGADVPRGVIERRCKQAGGGRVEMSEASERRVGMEDMTKRSMLNSHEDAARDYRRHVFTTGIPFRRHGLFPCDDRVLTMMSLDASLKPFQKAIPGPKRGTFVTCESWAVGDEAARRGLDLRYFYREASRGSNEHPELVGVARVGDSGAIGTNTWTLAHGGCIETILDETTAELVKCARAPCCVTIELNAKIKKPLPLHSTVKIHCSIKSVEASGLRIWTTATLTDPNHDDEVLATCEAQLCDAGMLNRIRTT